MPHRAQCEQVSSEVLQVSDGSLYPALHKLEQEAWIKVEWRVTESSRRAKFYSLTRLGHAHATKRGGELGAPVRRDLIRKMSRENPAWGAPRIHGELLKPGIDTGESSVSEYMAGRRKPPSQTWRTFLDNQLKSSVPVGFFADALLALAHGRRRILHFHVTAHLTAEWIAQQLREAFPFEQIPGQPACGRARLLFASICPAPAQEIARLGGTSTLNFRFLRINQLDYRIHL